MNDESSSSSAAKHVSFSALVDVIEDSAIEYVDLPPIIFESFDESDPEMSFTELTESSISDRYYETQQSLSEINTTERENHYNNFGDKSLTSMSFNDLYDSCGPMKNSSESLEEISAAAAPTVLPTVYNQVDLDSQSPENDNAVAVDDAKDNDDDSSLKPEAAPWYCGIMGILSSMLGMFGICFHCLSTQRTADAEDVVALTHVSATANHGFFIPSLLSDGGAAYITYVVPNISKCMHHDSVLLPFCSFEFSHWFTSLSYLPVRHKSIPWPSPHLRMPHRHVPQE